jgi:adenine-specific DNA-methyltransferase
MNQLENIEPFVDELPSVFAGRLADAFMEEEGKESKLVFTPVAVAHSLAAMNDFRGKKLNILEAGCGTAILSCAQLEYWALQKQKPQEVQLTVYETDFTLLALAEKALRYLKGWLKTHKVRFEYKLTAGDFILKNASVLGGSLFAKEQQQYDMVLSHPPTKRITQVDNWGQAVQVVGYSVPDSFAAFLSVSLCLLKSQGKLSYVLPRKFAYSTMLKEFRMHFFRQFAPQHIQLTDAPEGGLADHLILSGEKREDFHVGKLFSLSVLGETKTTQWPLWELLNLRSQAKVLALPAGQKTAEVYRETKAWKHRLEDLGLRIGSGKIESRHVKKMQETKGPVAYLSFAKMTGRQYKFQPDGELEHLNTQASSFAMPDQDYILLRAKARKSGLKLYASYYQKGTAGAELLALDKQCVYFTLGRLSEAERWGVVAYLNSEVLLHHISAFKGHKAPSLSEWKEIPFPDREALASSGRLLMQKDSLTEKVSIEY